jgi:tryptophanyl-tRNA synthetase
MEKNEVFADSFDEMRHHLNEVYANAQWALRCGATKESLLDQIEQALELHQECLLKDGWVRSDTEP